MRPDPDEILYRVLGDGDGYIYAAGEHEALTHGSGLLTAASPRFEVDSLARIGRWLFLGDRVRRLRIPPDAVVVRSAPLSQGGCYTWCADRVELLDIVSIAEVVAALGPAPVEVLHLRDYTFSAGFRFPPRVQALLLQGCLAADPLDFPPEIGRLVISDSALVVGHMPASVEELSLYRALLTGLSRLPRAHTTDIVESTVATAR